MKECIAWKDILQNDPLQKNVKKKRKKELFKKIILEIMHTNHDYTKNPDFKWSIKAHTHRGKISKEIIIK